MKTAIVTGGAKRIGESICRHLHDHGWRVIIHYNRSASAAEQLASELNAIKPTSAVCLQSELADHSSLNSFTQKCLSEFDDMSLLVNNASMFYPTPVEELDVQSFDELMTTNTRAPLFLIKALAPQLAGGSVVNIIDIHGATPLQDYAIYSASKAALGMLTRSLAVELAPDVRVNGVAPGAILWPEDAAEMSDAEKAELLFKIPMARLGDPLDIAKAVRFLADEAPFVTGQIINVDGGQSV